MDERRAIGKETEKANYKAVTGSTNATNALYNYNSSASLLEHHERLSICSKGCNK